MKTLPPDDGWNDRLRRARDDTPPPVDVPALLRAVRQAPLPERTSWLGEFAALFEPRHVVPACLAVAVLLGMISTWQWAETWQALPWAQLSAVAEAGGAS